MKKKSVAKLMEQYGLTKSQANYVRDGSRRDLNKPYTPRPRKSKKPEDLDKLDIHIFPNPNSQYGWDVIRSGKQKVIFVAKGTQYKDGGCKYYPAVAITHNYKQSLWSLSSLIWLGYLNKEIPAGYVIDHIDNDSFNNDPDNLQMLTIRQNIVKNPSKKLYNTMKRRELEDQLEVDLAVKSELTGIPVDELEELITK